MGPAYLQALRMVVTTARRPARAEGPAEPRMAYACGYVGCTHVWCCASMCDKILSLDSREPFVGECELEGGDEGLVEAESGARPLGSEEG